jgi:GNAT superfamily N-acetyltransferase
MRSYTSELVTEKLHIVEPKGTYSIRQANMDDLEVLVQLRLSLLREVGNLRSGTCTADLAEAIRQYFTKTLPTGQFVAWVAQVDGRIIGTSGVVMFERPPVDGNLSGLDAYIMNIYTIPSWRCKGVATVLLGEIISYVKQTDARRIWVHSTRDGKHLYKKFGFVSTLKEMELVW